MDQPLPICPPSPLRAHQAAIWPKVSSPKCLIVGLALPDDFEAEILALLADHKVPAAITLTKCDKLSRSQRLRRVREIGEALGISADSLFMSSAKSGDGRRELLGLLDEYSAIT
mgnify:CR=1 FL=1